MKKTTLIIGVLLFVGQIVYSQTLKVDKNNPFGGEEKEIYVSDGDKRVEIIQQLLTTTSEDGLDINTQINNCQLKITSIKVVSGTAPNPNTEPISSQIGSNSNEKSNTKTLTLKFMLPIAQTNSIQNGGTSQLPKNWSKFGYNISCSKPDGSTVARNGDYDKPASAVRTTLPIQLGKPIVHQNSPTTIIIPMLSPKTVKVGVRMLLASNERASGKGVLKGGEDAEKIILKATNPITSGEPYTLELTFPDFDDDVLIPEVATKTNGVFTSIKGNSATWNSQWTSTYTLNNAIVTNLTNMKISSSTEAKTIPVTTTSAIKILKIKIGNNSVFKECSSENELGNECSVIFSNTEIPEGESAIVFEGESQDGVPFTMPSVNLKVTKTAKPVVEGVPTFKVRNNNFTMTYKITGDLKKAKASVIYEDSIRANQVAFSKDGTCSNADSSGIRTCEFSIAVLDVVLEGITEEDKKNSTIPVRLQIDATDGNETEHKALDTISFELVNQKYFENELRKIENDFKSNPKNTNQTRRKIAKLLVRDENSTSDPIVTQTFEAIKDGSNKDKHKILFGILKVVTSFGLNAFGIPISF